VLPTIQLTRCLQRGNQAPRSKRDPHGGPKFRVVISAIHGRRKVTRGRPIGPSGTLLGDHRPRRTAETRKSSAARSLLRNSPSDQRRTVAAAVIISNVAQRAIPIFVHRQGYHNRREPLMARKNRSPASIPRPPAACNKPQQWLNTFSTPASRRSAETALPPQPDERKVVPSEGFLRRCPRC
jgi:hypothetical protein